MYLDVVSTRTEALVERPSDAQRVPHKEAKKKLRLQATGLDQPVRKPIDL